MASIGFALKQMKHSNGQTWRDWIVQCRQGSQDPSQEELDGKEGALLQILELQSLSSPDALFVGQEDIVSLATAEKKDSKNYVNNKAGFKQIRLP